MKAAISLPDELFHEIEACAREMKTSRSRVLAVAARDFLDRHRPRQRKRGTVRSHGRGSPATNPQRGRSGTAARPSSARAAGATDDPPRADLVAELQAVHPGEHPIEHHQGIIVALVRIPLSASVQAVT